MSEKRNEIPFTMKDWDILGLYGYGIFGNLSVHFHCIFDSKFSYLEFYSAQFFENMPKFLDFFENLSQIFNVNCFQMASNWCTLKNFDQICSFNSITALFDWQKILTKILKTYVPRFKTFTFYWLLIDIFWVRLLFFTSFGK